MTKNEKLKKLGNAIRDYRGMYHARTKAWIHAPKPSRLDRVREWALRLGLDESETVAKVNGFKSFDEFRDWMKAI